MSTRGPWGMRCARSSHTDPVLRQYVLSAADDVDIPEPPQRTVALDKRVAAVADVDGDGLTGVGDTIAWEFDLTNTGNVNVIDSAATTRWPPRRPARGLVAAGER